jgi:hypothetical protein
MASSFEKSVKGATKIKVRCPSQPSPPSVMLTRFPRPGSAPEDQVHRTHPRSNPCRRSRCRRGLPRTPAQATRHDMDRRFQEPNHSTPDDKRGVAGCHAGISLQAQELAGREHVLRRLVADPVRKTGCERLTALQLKPKAEIYAITRITFKKEPGHTATRGSTGLDTRIRDWRSCRWTRACCARPRLSKTSSQPC